MAKKKTHVWADGSRHSTRDPSLWSVDKSGKVQYGALGQKFANVLTKAGQKPLGPTQGQPYKPAPVQPQDPNVVNQQVIANRNVAMSDVYGTWQQGNLDQQYGYGAGGAANPYSDAAKIQLNYERSLLGTKGSYASQGQYNSGAYGSAQNENTRNYAIADDASRRAYAQASGQIGFDRLKAYADAGTGVDQSKFDALIKALGGV